MRIIKNDDAFETIAGEMLNIETSTYHYRDGRPLVVGRDITLAEYTGYPKITYDTVIDTIKGSSGYIFVPVGTDLAQFQESLIPVLLRMESSMVRLDGTAMAVLKQYHTVKCSYNTNVKIKSYQNLTLNSNVPHVAARFGKRAGNDKNVKRAFVTDPDGDARRGRFTWFIQTVDRAEQEITSENCEDALARYALSVLYDRDNICKHPHNYVTFEFARRDLVGSDNIVDERMTLFKYGNPLLFELSEHWRGVPVGAARAFLHNISANRVFEYDHAKLVFKPVSLTENGGETSTDVCSKCRSVLFGDNYALAGNVNSPENDMCVALCPLCMHSSPDDNPIEAKYFRVFRVTFPRRAEDLIDDVNISAERREMRREALKGVERKVVWVSDREVHYTVIGGKYVAFDNVDDFLYTKLSTYPDFSARKVCTAQLVD